MLCKWDASIITSIVRNPFLNPFQPPELADGDSDRVARSVLPFISKKESV